MISTFVPFDANPGANRRWWVAFMKGIPQCYCSRRGTIRREKFVPTGELISDLLIHLSVTAVGSKSAMDRPWISRYRASRGSMHKMVDAT